MSFALREDFNVNNVLYESYQLIPNTILETPIHEPIYLGISNSKKRYNVIYDWTYNIVSHPILVPDGRIVTDPRDIDIGTYNYFSPLKIQYYMGYLM